MQILRPNETSEITASEDTTEDTDNDGVEREGRVIQGVASVTVIGAVRPSKVPPSPEFTEAVYSD